MNETHESIWEREFGKEFAVPREILDLVKRGLAEDLSDHYTDCPFFGLREMTDGNTLVALNSGHPDPAKRSYKDNKRYYIFGYTHGLNKRQTDDSAKAVKIYTDMCSYLTAKSIISRWMISISDDESILRGKTHEEWIKEACLKAQVMHDKCNTNMIIREILSENNLMFINAERNGEKKQTLWNSITAPWTNADKNDEKIAIWNMLTAQLEEEAINRLLGKVSAYSLTSRIPHLRPHMTRYQMEILLGPEETTRALDPTSDFQQVNGVTINFSSQDKVVDSITFGGAFNFAPEVLIEDVHIGMSEVTLRAVLFLAENATGEPDQRGHGVYKKTLPGTPKMDIHVTVKDGKVYEFSLHRVLN